MSENKNIKKLTITEMRKQNKELEGKFDAVVKVNDDEFSVKIDKHFRKSKQHKVLDDLIEFISSTSDDSDLLGDVTPYMSLLIIKHFTDIRVPDKIEDALEILYIMIDLGILNGVMDAMPKEELMDVMELLANAMNMARKEIEKDAEEARSVYDEVENEEIKKMIDEEFPKEG